MAAQQCSGSAFVKHFLQCHSSLFVLFIWNVHTGSELPPARGGEWWGCWGSFQALKPLQQLSGGDTAHINDIFQWHLTGRSSECQSELMQEPGAG